jgi:hypothetical protein
MDSWQIVLQHYGNMIFTTLPAMTTHKHVYTITSKPLNCQYYGSTTEWLFNHLSDVKHEVDYYHSVLHGILASLPALGLKELSFPEKNVKIFTCNLPKYHKWYGQTIPCD